MHTDDGNPGGGSDPAKSAEDLAAMATHEIEDRLARGRARLLEMQELVARRARECAQTTDAYIHDNPWQALALAAGVGMLVGLLMRRS
jgi:ElaB/YqjD/DUF883 family membrane-anchored ribosome-binding protein